MSWKGYNLRETSGCGLCQEAVDEHFLNILAPFIMTSLWLTGAADIEEYAPLSALAARLVYPSATPHHYTQTYTLLFDSVLC